VQDSKPRQRSRFQFGFRGVLARQRHAAAASGGRSGQDLFLRERQWLESRAADVESTSARTSAGRCIGTGGVTQGEDRVRTGRLRALRIAQDVKNCRRGRREHPGRLDEVLPIGPHQRSEWQQVQFAIRNHDERLRSLAPALRDQLCIQVIRRLPICLL